MFLESIKNKYPNISVNGDILELSSNFDSLEPLLFELKNQFSFCALVDLICFDKLEENGRFILIYQLVNLDEMKVLNLTIEILESSIVPSVRDLWKNAKGLELEIEDLFGVKFSNLSGKRIFNHLNFVGHPLRKNFRATPFDFLSHSDIGFNRPGETLSAECETEWINIGPYHPATDSGLRLMTQLYGEQVQKAYVEIGLTHKGLEKRFESLNFKKLVVSSQLMDISYADTFNIMFADCIEEFFDIDIPERAKVVRMFILEVERIGVHLDSIARLAKYLRGERLLASVTHGREILQELYSKIFSKRHSGGNIRLGGAVDIFKNTSVFEFFETLKILRTTVEESKKLFYSLDSWMKELDDLKLNSNEAVCWGMTGPVLRASGVNWDLRKRSPLYFYRDLDFSVPCGVEGNSYDRFVVRFEETLQSISILEQLLDYIPSGELVADLSATSFSKSGIGFSKLEGPNGIISCVMEFDGTLGPSRVKIRPSTFPMCMALEELLPGKPLPDSLIGMISLNINTAEIDR